MTFVSIFFNGSFIPGESTKNLIGVTFLFLILNGPERAETLREIMLLGFGHLSEQKQEKC